MAAYRTWHGSPADRRDGVRLAAELAQQSNNPSLLIWRSWATGIALTNGGDQDRATASHRTTLELARAAGHHVMEVTACVMLSISLFRARKLDPDDHQLVLETVRRTGLQAGPSISALAQLLLHAGREEPAAVLLGHLERQSAHLAAISPILEELRRRRTTATSFIERGAALNRTEMLDYASSVLDGIEPTASEAS